MYGFSLERMPDTILYEVYNSDMPRQLRDDYYSSFCSPKILLKNASLKNAW
jgi:hypothetical protein